MRLPVLVLTSFLLVAGCGDDGEGGAGPDTDVCDRLSLEDASRVVGVDYAANGQTGDICYYQRPGTDQAFGLRLLGYTDDFDTVLADSEELGYVATPLEVAGAERAVALSGRLRIVLAEAGGDTFEVAFNGDARIAARLMTIVLGGTDSGATPRPVSNPCDQLSAPQVRRLLGVPAKAKPGAGDPALKSCTWRRDGRTLVVAAGRGRGPVEEFWDENFFVGEGAEPESIAVRGADGALLVSDKRGENAGVAVARGDLSYIVTVGGGVPDPRASAVEAAGLLLAAS